MSRLMKKAFGKTLWHGTSLEKFKEIVSNGAIFPNETEGAGPAGADERLFDGFSFFATDFSVAKYYAISRAINDDSAAIVIEVDVSEDALLPDDNDVRDAKTWQDSADVANQVKITGPIYDDLFQTIYVFDSKGSMVGNTPFNQWESFYEENENRILNIDDYEDDEEYYVEDLDWDDEDLDLEIDFDDDDFEIDDDDYEDDFIEDEDILEYKEGEEFDWDSLFDTNEKNQTVKSKITRLRKEIRSNKKRY